MAKGMSCRTNGMMWVLIKIGTNGQRPQNWSVLLLNHSIRQQVLSHTMVSQVYIICPMFISYPLAKACKDSGTSTVIDIGIFVWPFHAQRYLKLHRPPDPYDGGDLLALWSLDSGVEDLEESPVGQLGISDRKSKCIGWVSICHHPTGHVCRILMNFDHDKSI